MFEIFKIVFCMLEFSSIFPFLQKDQKYFLSFKILWEK